jgi:hypothetical protein
VSIFGAITIATQLEKAILETLQTWFYTYLVEYELQAGLINDKYTTPKHPMPKSWLTSDQFSREASDNLPSIVVVSPGTSIRTMPYQEGDGSYRVFFLIGIGAFAGANKRSDALQLVRTYVAICRTIALQKQSFGGFASGSEWIQESYDDNFGFTDDQTISCGQTIFEIEVSGLVERFGGPTATIPTPEMPGSEWPVATDVSVDVELVEEIVRS